MRSSSYILAAAGLSLILLSTPRAEAMTTSSPAGLRAGLEAIDLTEAVHCRRYSHRHRSGHRWGRGCGRTVIIERSRPDIVVRERRRSRTGVEIRSGRGSSTTTIRSRSGGSGGSGGSSGTSTTTTTAPSSGAAGTTKSDTSTTKSGTSTTTKSGTSGGTGTSTTIQGAPK